MTHAIPQFDATLSKFGSLVRRVDWCTYSSTACTNELTHRRSVRPKTLLNPVRQVCNTPISCRNLLQAANWRSVPEAAVSSCTKMRMQNPFSPISPDSLVGAGTQRWRHGEAECPCGLEIENKSDFVGRPTRLGAPADARRPGDRYASAGGLMTCGEASSPQRKRGRLGASFSSLEHQYGWSSRDNQASDYEFAHVRGYDSHQRYLVSAAVKILGCGRGSPLGCFQV
jgi:hypothetical protein